MQIVYRLLFSVSQRSSTSAGANSDWSDAVAEADVVLPKKGMVLLFQPLSIAFNHINYFIDMPPVSSAFYAIRIYSFLLVMLGSKCGLLWGFLFGIFFSIAFNFLLQFWISINPNPPFVTVLNTRCNEPVL
jgi:hypothetical protein